MENIITVTKTASQYVSPNSVEIRIIAVGEDKRCATAVAECTRIEEAVYSLASKHKISVAYSDMQVSPVCRDGKTVGYRAVKPLSVEEKTSTANLDDFLDGLGELQVAWRVNFEFDDKDGSVRKALLQTAVKDAVADAKVLADAAGVKLGALHGIEYNPSCAPAMYRAARADVDFQPIQVSETVVCSFKIA